MNPILDPPRSLLVVGLEETISAPVRRALEQGHDHEILDASTAHEVGHVLEGRADVGCVLTAWDLPEGTCADVCEAVRAHDEDLPTVLVLDGDAVEVESETFPSGAWAAVSADAGPDRLREVVDDALSTYVRRRGDAEHRDMLDGLLSNIGEAIYFKDTEGRHVRISEVPGGFEPERAQGKTDVELYGEDDVDAAREAYEDDIRVISNEEPVYGRIERVGDEQDLWMRTTKVPWVDEDGRKRGLIGLTINVTEYKQTERDFEALARRFETFTSRLSHDVKTPLQVASGNLEMALEDDDERAVETARDAVERAEQIIEDYETLSEQARAVQDGASPVALADIVSDVWAAIESPDEELVLEIDGEAYVNATEEMVRPVVENLLKNAVVHTDGGVTIRVGTTEDGFYVEDTGEGLPEDDRQKVLEEGYTTARDGSGRGLSIVKNEMDKHLWSLDLDESPEGGARFQIDGCLASLETPAASGDDDSFEIDGTAAVGDLEWGGHAEYVEEFDQWRVTGDGVDIYRQDNEFYYAFATLHGPASIQGRIVGVEYVDDFSKGGFMVRDSLSPDASYAFVGQTPGHGTEILYREAAGENGYSVPVEDNAFRFNWYRIDREGRDVRLSLSMDGEHWQPIETFNISLDDPVHVGMVACSCVPGQPCEVTFEGVRAFDHPLDG